MSEEIGPPVMQTYEKVFEDAVIWEGDRTEVITSTLRAVM